MRLLLALLIACCGTLFGDSGTVLFRSPAGPFNVTVFNKSDAVRVGINDLSVMVQSRDASNTITNAKVLLHLTQSINGDITRVTALATHEKATNKTLYAAAMKLPSTGDWKLAVDVSVDGQSAVAAGNIEVKPPPPPMATYWPYVAMVPALSIAFVINRTLRRRFLRRR